MTVQSIDWRPEDPAVLANPYPIFQRMRDEPPLLFELALFLVLVNLKEL